MKKITIYLLIVITLTLTGCENSDENSKFIEISNASAQAELSETVSIEPNIHPQYSDEVKFYNMTELFADTLFDFTYIGNDRIILSIRNENDLENYDAVVQDIDTKEIINKITFNPDYLERFIFSYPLKYENNGFSYTGYYSNDLLYVTYDNKGNLTRSYNLFENNKYSENELNQINKNRFIITNNNGIILYRNNNDICLKNFTTGETKTLFTDNEDSSLYYGYYWFIDENRILLIKHTESQFEDYIIEPFIYNIIDGSYNKIDCDLDYSKDLGIRFKLDNKIFGLGGDYIDSSYEEKYLYNITISDNYKATSEKVWTCEKGQIITYDYSDDEKIITILSCDYYDESPQYTITSLDADTYEVFFEKTIKISSDEYNINYSSPIISILSDNTITLKLSGYDLKISSNNTNANNVELLYIIKPENN